MTFNSSSSSVATPACLGTEAPPVGFRFHPTDTELITDFLGPKIRRQDDYIDPPIADVEVCKFEPWDLPVRSKIQSNDRVWYFFSPRQHKSKNTTRSNRKTNKGFWKPDGKLRQIRAKHSKQVIGSKRTLVFHLGHYKESVRTKWVMHEYECLPSSGLYNQLDFVLLKLKDKSDENDTKPDAYHQTALNPEIESQELVEMADISSHGNRKQCDMMSSGSYYKNQDIWIIGAVGELVDANSVDSSPTIDSNAGSLSTSDYLQTLSQQSSQTPKSSPQSSFTHISPCSPPSNTSLCCYQNNNITEVQLPLQISSQTPKTIPQTSNFQIFDSLPAINSPLCHFQNNDFIKVTSFDGLLASDLESKCEDENKFMFLFSFIARKSKVEVNALKCHAFCRETRNSLLNYGTCCVRCLRTTTWFVSHLGCLLPPMRVPLPSCFCPSATQPSGPRLESLNETISYSNEVECSSRESSRLTRLVSLRQLLKK